MYIRVLIAAAHVSLLLSFVGLECALRLRCVLWGFLHMRECVVRSIAAGAERAHLRADQSVRQFRTERILSHI